jgi:hypothetical protein
MTVKKSVDTTNVPLSNVPGQPDIKGPEADNLAPATEVAASGTFIEPEIVARVDTDHPAVDNAPRKGAPATSNQIDFNTPSALQSEEDAVVEKLTEAED